MRLLLLMLFVAISACHQTARQTEPDPFSAWKDKGDFEGLLEGVEEHEREVVRREVDRLLAQALEGVARTADPRTKLLHLNWYVHAHFESQDPEPYSIASMLQEQKAQCGGSAVTLQLLARRLGYETRTAGFFGIPQQGGHTVAEVKWGGKWRFLDPTFGAFVSSDGTFDGEIVSFDTVQKYRSLLAANTFYAVSQGRLGKRYSRAKPASLSDLYSRQQSAMQGVGNYAIFLAHMTAASIYDAGAGKTLTAPYAVAFTDSAQRVALGEKDGSHSDIVLHHTMPGWRYDATGLYFLGNLSGTYGALFGEHEYQVSGLMPGERFLWRGGLTFGDPDLIEVSVRKAVIESVRTSEDSITVTARALRSDAEVRLTTAKDKRIIFDYLEFERTSAE